MATHVALLRGINVGGHARVAMTDLRAIVSSLGHTDVVTYIQSGNVVFSAAGRAVSEALAADLQAAIAKRLAVRPAVIVLSRTDLQAVVDGNPYPSETNLRSLHAVFMPHPLSPEEVAALAAAQQRTRAKGGDDELSVAGTTVYLHTPAGFGRSVLAAELGRGASRTVMAAGTARNWATVTVLLELLGR